jgi:hypothetical protein
MAVFTLVTVCVSAQTVTGTVTDIETGLAVPYAIIQNSAGAVTRNSIVEASVDGKFSINVTTGATYTASRLGYKPVTLTAEQLLLDKVIRMEMLPYELNPVIVTSGTALQDIYRASEATRKRIPATPFFRRCYKKEEIIAGDDTLLDAKAIIDVKVIKITKHRLGIFCISSLKGLQINYREPLKTPYSSPIFFRSFFLKISQQISIIPYLFVISCYFYISLIYTHLIIIFIRVRTHLSLDCIQLNFTKHVVC